MRRIITIYIRILVESFHFAYQSMLLDKLRTLLSLIGITIGIFTIISVFTLVDSLEIGIRKNIESLGDNVLFIQKWPWAFSSDYPWWKYFNRPVPSIEDFKEIEKRSYNIEAVSFVVTMNKSVEFESNTVNNVQITSVSEGYDKIWNFELQQGRFISEYEFKSGKNVAVIGADVAKNLFNNRNPLGEKINLMGRKVEVIGVFKKEGESILRNSKDYEVVLPINFIRNIIDINSDNLNPFIMVKGKKGVLNDFLISELRGIMRSVRKLKPTDEDNFSINEVSLLTKNFDSLFSIISIAGWIIGGFSILVGGFGVANIMFVSVKERTAIIGIKKSLGAKNYFVLLEFLLESVILCIIGGSVGLFLIFIGTLFSGLFDVEISLTIKNIIRGISISFVVGILAGFIPAYVASVMNPVEAIRTAT